MGSILEYYVMRDEKGDTLWLDADEQSWTGHFHNAAAFTDAKLASDIAKRELGNEQPFYVMGCMASEG